MTAAMESTQSRNFEKAKISRKFPPADSKGPDWQNIEYSWSQLPRKDGSWVSMLFAMKTPNFWHTNVFYLNEGRSVWVRKLVQYLLIVQIVLQTYREISISHQMSWELNNQRSSDIPERSKHTKEQLQKQVSKDSSLFSRLPLRPKLCGLVVRTVSWLPRPMSNLPGRGPTKLARF